MSWIFLTCPLAYYFKDRQWINQSLISLHINYASFSLEMAKFAEDVRESLILSIPLLPLSSEKSTFPVLLDPFSRSRRRHLVRHYYGHNFTQKLLQNSQMMLLTSSKPMLRASSSPNIVESMTILGGTSE